jgi:hypothetical protein
MDLSHLCRFKMRCLGSVQFIPQEYRVYLHSCLLPSGLSNRLLPKSEGIGIEADDALGEEVSRVRLPIKRGAFVVFLAGSVTTVAGLLAGEFLPSLVARFAAK